METCAWIAFDFGGDQYAANQCRYDYLHETSWCATSLNIDGSIDEWKICDIENTYTTTPYTTDRASKEIMFVNI